MRVERWGPYCPIPQDHSRYVRQVHPTVRGLIRDDSRAVREMTAEEVEVLEGKYAEALDNFFVAPE